MFIGYKAIRSIIDLSTTCELASVLTRASVQVTLVAGGGTKKPVRQYYDTNIIFSIFRDFKKNQEIIILVFF